MKPMSMVDMSLDTKEQEEYASPSPPKYPYGLCISLCDDELEKLGLDGAEVERGDMLHMHCLAQVTCVSSVDNESGKSNRIELQIKFIEVEDEEEENKEEDKKISSKLYHSR